MRHVWQVLQRRTVQDKLGNLAALARSGDDEALKALVRETAPRVRRWALVQTGDPDAADDVAQNVLIQMVASLDSLDDPHRIERWLYSAVRNAAVDLHRKERRHGGAPAVDPDAMVSAEPGPQERLASMERQRLLVSLFQRLPRRQREVFDLVELKGMTAPEAAEVLGIRATTVRVNLFKARATLRRRLIAAGVEDAR